MQRKYFNLAISGLAILAGIATAYGQQNPDPGHSPRAHSIHSNFMHVETDSSVNPPQTMITYKEDKQFYTIRTVDDKIIDLSVNGRKIPSDSFYVYDAMVGRIEKQIKLDRAQAEEDRKQAVKDEEQAKRDEEQAEQDAQQAVSDARQAKIDAEEAMKEREEMKEDAARDVAQAKRDAQEAERDAVQAKRDAEQARIDAIQARKDEAQAVKDQAQARIDAKHAAEDRAKMKNLIAELIKEGVVPDEQSLYSLEVSDTDLIINGKKQPDELRKRICAQFKVGPGYCISYHQ